MWEKSEWSIALEGDGKWLESVVFRSDGDWI